MNAFRYIVRPGIVLIVVVGTYLGTMRLVNQAIYMPTLIGLLLLALGIEAVWVLVRWFSPLHGLFGEPDQELALVRVLERELSRSLRHDAPLVIVAIQGRWNLSRKAVNAQLRLSDIVMRGRGKHLLVLMTETELTQAQLVLERMVLQLPIRVVAMTNQVAIQAGAATGGFGDRYQTRDDAAYGPSLTLLRGLQLGLFRARARIRHGASAPIYVLGPNELVYANATMTTRPLDDLTERVA